MDFGKGKKMKVVKFHQKLNEIYIFLSFIILI